MKRKKLYVKFEGSDKELSKLKAIIHRINIKAGFSAGGKFMRVVKNPAGKFRRDDLQNPVGKFKRTIVRGAKFVRARK